MCIAALCYVSLLTLPKKLNKSWINCMALEGPLVLVMCTKGISRMFNPILNFLRHIPSVVYHKTADLGFVFVWQLSADNQGVYWWSGGLQCPTMGKHYFDMPRRLICQMGWFDDWSIQGIWSLVSACIFIVYLAMYLFPYFYWVFIFLLTQFYNSGLSFGIVMLCMFFVFFTSTKVQALYCGAAILFILPA